MKLLKIIKHKTNFDFVKIRYIGLFSAVIFVILPFILMHGRGINWGIDFTGGALLEIQINNTATNNLSTIRNYLTEQNIDSFSIQILDSDNDLEIRFKEQEANPQMEKIKSLLKDLFKNDIVFKKVDYVGSKLSDNLLTSGLLAFVASMLGIFSYLLFRFNAVFAFAGVISLAHDVLGSACFIAITGIEFNFSSVAAILTIVGYSINDSVVIYDRMKEIIHQGEKDCKKMINLAINSTLSRTILTSLTTLIAIIPIIFLCKGEVQDFSLLVFYGVLIGTYSSIFISAPILYMTNSGGKGFKAIYT